MKRPGFAERLVKQAAGSVFATGQKLHFPASSRRQNYLARKPERDSFSLSLPPTWTQRICGVVVFGGSCNLKAVGGVRFQPPAGVSRGHCGEVRKGACHRCLSAFQRQCSRLGGEGATPSCPTHSWPWRPCCRCSPGAGRGKDREDSSLSESEPLTAWGSCRAIPLEPRLSSELQFPFYSQIRPVIPALS